MLLSVAKVKRLVSSKDTLLIYIMYILEVYMYIFIQVSLFHALRAAKIKFVNLCREVIFFCNLYVVMFGFRRYSVCFSVICYYQ